MLQGRVKGNIIEYLLLLVLTAGSYLGVNALKWQNETRGIQAVMALLLAGCAGYMLLLKGLNRWKEDRAVMVVIVMGCIMRIGYMLYTPVTLRGHDMFELDVNAYGKAGYLLRLAVEGRLPESNVLQLYQQPFYYMAGAFVSRLLNGILGSEDMFLLVDAAKVVSCWASCMTLVLVEKIFQVLGVSKKSTWYGMMAAAYGRGCFVYFLSDGSAFVYDVLGKEFRMEEYYCAGVILWVWYDDENFAGSSCVVYGMGIYEEIMDREACRTDEERFMVFWCGMGCADRQREPAAVWENVGFCLYQSDTWVMVFGAKYDSVWAGTDVCFTAGCKRTAISGKDAFGTKISAAGCGKSARNALC